MSLKFFPTLLSNYFLKRGFSLCIVQAGERAAATSKQGAGREKKSTPHPLALLVKTLTYQALLVGLYKDQESALRRLRAPNNVVNYVMPVIWGYLTWKWQGKKQINKQTKKEAKRQTTRTNKPTN